MPVLHRKKSSDGYYFVQRINGPFVTWQVSPDGVSWLHQRGITEGMEIPRTLIRELIQQDLAYTGGSGIGDQVLVDVVDTTDAKYFLAFQETEEAPGWQLSVVFAELPAAWFAGMDAGGAVRRLAGCSIRVAGVVIPAKSLQPGSGGASCPVPPQAVLYQITAPGSWPVTWDMRPWLGIIDGLRREGTLFAGPEFAGRRLRSSEAMVPGRTYYLVRTQHGTGAIPLPPTVQAQRIGHSSGWEALVLQIPFASDERVQAWCHEVGHPLAVPPWRITLVSPPPHRYLATGLPVVPSNITVLLAALPPPNAERSAFPTEIQIMRDGILLDSLHLGASNPQYLTILVGSSGNYRVHSPGGRIATMAFAVDVDTWRAADLTRQPPPLSVHICDSVAEHRVHAFDPENAGGITLTSGEAALAIEVACPVPVTLVRQDADARSRRNFTQSADLATALVLDLEKSRNSKQTIEWVLDAAAFGLVHLQLVGPPSPQPELTGEIPVALQRRARWLAMVLPALATRPGVHLIPLSPAIRAALAPLQSDPVAGALPRLRLVPLTYLPQLLALARALRQYRTSHLTSESKSI